MTDQFARPLSGLDEDGLGSALTALAPALDWPATPMISASVGASLHARPGGPAHGARTRWFGSLRRGLALGLVAALLLAGIAAGIGFALGGLRITFTTYSPSAMPSFDISTRPFGEETTLNAARDQVEWQILVPDISDLGPPDRVYVAEPPLGGAAALVWGDRAGLPAGADGIGLVLTEFRADIGPDTFEKMINSGVSVDRTTVNGNAGYWVAGGEHFFFYRDANGVLVEGTIRLVGTALMWEQDGLTLRIEGAPTLDEAQRVAESLR